ncbi:hypothetical protein AB205_0021040 [Aquarana catesbeiana]|uniref:Uncharacterized protein n=1 Tax=Aquarana catesbeiana TaxID=8400 RepID=A0A2G9SD12_AQUCT|nr:hypothetical protein AB205_0021040 [Aquarana catesbeiana]PIO37394.1 hypothetical protein AB205_0021040 [Aquarana catesbeiana]
MTNPTYSGSNYKEMTVCYFSSVLIVLKLNLGIRLNTQLKYIDSCDPNPDIIANSVTSSAAKDLLIGR